MALPPRDQGKRKREGWVFLRGHSSLAVHLKAPAGSDVFTRRHPDLNGNARWSLSAPRGDGHSKNLKFPNLQVTMGAPLSESAVT